MTSESKTGVGFLDLVNSESYSLLHLQTSTDAQFFYIFRFYLDIYHFDSQESDGAVVNRKVLKQLPQPASGDAKILLSNGNF